MEIIYRTKHFSRNIIIHLEKKRGNGETKGKLKIPFIGHLNAFVDIIESKASALC